MRDYKINKVDKKETNVPEKKDARIVELKFVDSNPNTHYTKLDEVRFVLEHFTFKNNFLSKPDVIVYNVLKDGGLFKIYDSILNDLKINNPYKVQDFVVYRSDSDDGEASIICMSLPAPESDLSCYRVYIGFNKSYTKLAYFTVEGGSSGVYLYQLLKGDLRKNLGKIEKPIWGEGLSGELDRLFEEKRVIEAYTHI